MNIKELITKMLLEGKSEDEIITEVMKSFPETSAEDFEKSYTESEKAATMKKALDAKKAADQKAQSDANDQKALDDKIATSVKSALEAALKDIDLAGISGKDASVVTTGFKSFLVNIIGVKNDWKEDMLKMIKADRQKDFDTAIKYHKQFVEQTKLLSDELKQKTLTGDTTTGSYAVPDQFSDLVFFTAQRGSNIFDNGTKLTVQSDKLNLLGVSADVVYTEVADQSTSLTNSEPTLTQTSLDIIDVGAVSYLHDDLIADSNINVIQLLADSYGRGLAKYLKRATTVGNIATTGDKINGIYSISGVGSLDVLDPAGTISYDDIMGLIGSIDEIYLDGAVFEMNLRELIKCKKIKDQNGQPILISPTLGQPFFSILGFPVRLNNQIPLTLDAATGARATGNTTTILFGDPSQVIIGLKGGFMFESSMHYKFPARQTTFRGYQRWDMDLVNVSAMAVLKKIK